MDRNLALAIFFRAAWRPAAGWICTLVLLANGVILPLSRIWGTHIEPLDWRNMTVFVGAILGLAGMRSFDKSKKCEDADG